MLASGRILVLPLVAGDRDPREDHKPRAFSGTSQPLVPRVMSRMDSVASETILVLRFCDSGSERFNTD